MRVIRQGGSSFISLRVHDTQVDGVGLVQTSQAARGTEIEALKAPSVRDNGKDYVIEPPPSPDHVWCSCCGWLHKRHFNANPARKSGYDNYCRDCRKRLRKVRITSKTLTET